MAVELRDYQSDLIRKVYGAIQAGKEKGKLKGVIASATGSGKTIVIGQIAAHALKKGKSVLILVHLDALFPQVCSALGLFGLSYGKIKSGEDEDRFAPIQVAMLQTYLNRQWAQEAPFDILMWDECHQTAFWDIGQQSIKDFHSEACHLGFTATPSRLSKREGLSDLFDWLVWNTTPSDLQKRGFLAPMTYYQIDRPDLSAVKILAGEFNKKELAVACDTDKAIETVIKNWLNRTNGKRTIAFCTSIQHAERLAQAFRDVGVVAESVSSETPYKERTKLYKALYEGELLVLTSVNVVAIGFDCPPVEVGIDCAPTQSSARHIQRIGRVMRIHEGKERGLWFDYSGNIDRHGVPEDIVEYSLDEGCVTEPGDPPYKDCPECDLKVHLSVMECPECGYEFPRAAKVELEGEVVELTRLNTVRREQTSPDSASNYYRARLVYAYNHKPKPWRPGKAFVEYQRRYQGRKPPYRARQHSIFDRCDDNSAQQYLLYLSHVVREDENIGWLKQQFYAEFGKTQHTQKQFQHFYSTN